MTLKDELYTVVHREDTHYTIRMNPDSVIYAAHFPGHPITPGVCIVQIVEELTADALQQPLDISEMQSVKFISVLTPDNGTAVDCTLDITADPEDDTIKVKATLRTADTTIAKLTLLCTPRQTCTPK